MEHVNWFTSRNSDWRTFLIYYGGDLSILARPVGVVTIGQLDYWECEIGIYIGELTLWGKGVGRGALESAIDWVRVNKGSHVVAVRSTILDNNKRSNRLFKSVGFYRVGKAREGESLYRLVL